MKRGIAALIVLIAVAGCGSSSKTSSSSYTTLDPNAVAGDIKTQIQQQLGLTVSAASCPSGQPAQVGKNFDCAMTLSNGESEQIAVVPTDNKGTYTIRPAQIVATFVESTLEQRAQKQGAQIKATCPTHVPVVVGNRFNCMITTASGQRGIIGITIADHDGNFTPDHHARPA